jgi:hypothetical protein
MNNIFYGPNYALTFGDTDKIDFIGKTLNTFRGQQMQHWLFNVQK